MTFTVEGNASNVVSRLEAIDDRVRNELKSVVGALESELLGKIKAKTPVLSGALKQSIEGRVVAARSGVIAEISANPTGGDSKGSRRAYYALFIEYGAKLPAHDIGPSATQALKFDGGAGAVFAKHVRFPGGKIDAQEMMHGPFDEMRPRIVAEIKAAVEGKI
jgi:hypothetical protein